MKKLKMTCLLLAAATLFTACSTEGDSGSDTTTTTDGLTHDDLLTTQPNFTDTSSDDFTGNVGDVTLQSGDTYAVISVKGYGDITIKLFPQAAPIGVQNFIDLANNGYYNGKSIHRVMTDFMIQGGSLNGDGTGGTAADGGTFAVEYNKNMRHFYGALCYANSGANSNTCQFFIVNNKTADNCDSYTSDYLKEQMSLALSYAEACAEQEGYEDYYNYYIANANQISGMLKALEDLSDAAKEKYKDGGSSFLDGGYTVFGQTVDGFDVLDAISAAEVEAQSETNNELSKPVQEILISSVTIATK